MASKNRTLLVQQPLEGFEAPVRKWERIVLEMPNGHTRIVSRKIA
jgi:hypothetical protein